MFFSICVLATIMCQSVHTYSHLLADFFHTDAHHPQKEKIVSHHSDNCQICHFTLSPFTTLNPAEITFYTSIDYPELNVNYQVINFETLFSFILLRGPPAFV